MGTTHPKGTWGSPGLRLPQPSVQGPDPAMGTSGVEYPPETDYNRDYNRHRRSFSPKPLFSGVNNLASRAVLLPAALSILLVSGHRQEEKTQRQESPESRHKK